MAARLSKRLTVLRVETAKNAGKTPIMLADGDGLYLRVAPGGRKSWVYRYRVGAKAHDMGLGPYPARGLAAARKLALEQRQLRIDDRDPLTERRAVKMSKAPTITFKQAAEKWIAAKEAEWSTKHRGDIVSSLSAHAYPVIGDMPVADVDTATVMRVIEPKWLTLTETMSRVRSRIEAVLGYAVTSGYRAPGDNPARWEKHIENLLPKKSKTAPPTKHPKLDYQDIAGFMATLRGPKSKHLEPEIKDQAWRTARALEFTILTAARTGEVIGATWPEFDLEARVWTIPAERMKMGVEHRVPLSAPALALLRALPRDGDLVFGKLVNNSMIRLLDRFGITNKAGQKITVHGFRGVFSTWAAEAKFQYEVRELALAHQVGNDVERRYNTADLLDDRRRLMAAWADHCDGKPAGDNVVPIEQRRA